MVNDKQSCKYAKCSMTDKPCFETQPNNAKEWNNQINNYTSALSIGFKCYNKPILVWRK